MSQGGTKNALQEPKEDVREQHLKKEESKQGDTPLLSSIWVKELLPQ